MKRPERQKYTLQVSFTKIPKRLVCIVIVLFSMLHSSAHVLAQPQELNAVSLLPRGEKWTFLGHVNRAVKSSMALSSTGDLFVFTASPDGRWVLSRLRNWSDNKLQVTQIVLPRSFTNSERRGLMDLDTQILLTDDGKYAVCMVRAEWIKNSKPAKSIYAITTVQLQDFTIGLHVQTNTLGLHHVQSVRAIDDGHLLIDGVTNSMDQVLVPLNISSLQEAPKCYAGTHADNCMQIPGATESGESQSPSSTPATKEFTCGNLQKKYCPQPNYFSPDSRFGTGFRHEVRLSILGRWTWNSPAVVVFSTKSLSEIGEIDIRRDGVDLLLSSTAGHDYLYVLRANSNLAIYELQEPGSDPRQ